MVAKVISGKDIKGALNYNELKVIEGKAALISANGFLKDVHALSFYDKLHRFTALNELNQRTKTNTLHISLNFDPSEKLSADELNRIASVYMTKIGFGDQPYLVYEHKDAAHRHVHIVTTIIQLDGKRIPIHYLGKNQSETARKEIEIEFGLVKASSKVLQQAEPIKAADVKKVIYGKSATRKSISNVVRGVIRGYRFASLPELNAALRQYNVIADRGTENSRMFKNNGLIYSLLDEKGKRIGIPVKASAIYERPTLKSLEKRFKLNEALKQPHKDGLKKSMDHVLKFPAVKAKQDFISAMNAKGVAVLFRSNAEGRTFGLTFVDNNTKCVFNGSALGKEYSAASVLKKLSINEDTIRSVNEIKEQSSHDSTSVIKDLITSDTFDPRSPEAALRLGRKKKKRKHRRI